MILWRISTYSDLSGRGGFIAGGRWHTVGRPVVYLAGTPAGAMLEILVHLEVDQEDLPDTLQLLKIVVPDHASVAPAPELESGWEMTPRVTKALGDNFLRSGSALLLPIPSAIMPHTENFLFNPMHVDSSAAMVTKELFSMDARLVRS